MLGFRQVYVEKSCNLSERYLIPLESESRLRLPREAFAVKAFYEASGVEFLLTPDGKRGVGIRWKSPDTSDVFYGKAFRAARGLAALSQDELAEEAQVGRKIISTLERGIWNSINPEARDQIERCFKDRNIEVTVATATYGAGARWIVLR
jgi:DNA-binding XRE family transcriptional regulator